MRLNYLGGGRRPAPLRDGARGEIHPGAFPGREVEGEAPGVAELLRDGQVDTVVADVRHPGARQTLQPQHRGLLPGPEQSGAGEGT